MGNLCGGGAPKETKVTTADKPAPEEPLPLSVITDGKAREAKIRDVFGQLFAYWDIDRDGWLKASDWATHNQAGAASDSAWMEMSRGSARADAIDRERFLEFYIRFYLPKDEAEYRMYLEHWGSVAAAHKRAWEQDAARLRASVAPGTGGDLPRASNGYQPAALRASSAQPSPSHAPSANGIPNGATGHGAGGGGGGSGSASGRPSGGASGSALQQPQPLQQPQTIIAGANPNAHTANVAVVGGGGGAGVGGNGDGPMGAIGGAVAGTESVSSGVPTTPAHVSVAATPVKAGTGASASVMATPATPGAIPFVMSSP